MPIENEIAVFGGGCFWCTEAIFNELKGIISAKPGYAGGSVDNPTYEQVSTGKTGHVEVTRVEFNPSQISFKDLLTVFFGTHDPTSLDRQGNDIGSQYRSVIFYTTTKQKDESTKVINELKKSGLNIVTEIRPLDVFYNSEDYHQKYYENHKDDPYCLLVINPKLKKLKEKFSNLLKESSKNK